ncbi:MAG TPA: hypothetical protein VGO58_07905 [Chitinophagaceae bacterium]|jgi:hypothetical protein|nr:hypothetical protein [Chitinophagaceae bacterium]
MKVSLLIVVLFISVSVLGQKDQFPGSWMGNWKGTLEWYKTGKEEPQKINIELRIAAGDSTGNYTWQIIYGAVGEDNRPYLLRSKDAAKNHWVIDELNGIVLDQFWVGKRFCGAFTVAGNTIVNNYWMEDGKLLVEFFSIAAKPIVTTGNGTEQVPNVDSYRVGSYQKAVLTREK